MIAQRVRGGSTNITDTDALAYITAVNAADGSTLEKTAQRAIQTFIAGLKSDGIWSALSLCYVLCGARTLSGALVPLKGPAPTNVNFVAADYTRAGLKGDGTSKYLNTNLNSSALASLSHHLYVRGVGYETTGDRIACGVYNGATGGPTILTLDITTALLGGNRGGRSNGLLVGGSYGPFFNTGYADGGLGLSRTALNSVKAFQNGVLRATKTDAAAWSNPSLLFYLFALRNTGADGGVGGHTAARLRIATIGSGLSDAQMTALDARAATLESTLVSL